MCFDLQTEPFSKFPLLSDIRDPFEQRKYATLPGARSERCFGFVDSRPRPESGYPDGECSDGIELYRHPEAVIRDSDKTVRKVVRMWRFGVRPEQFTIAEYTGLSAYVIECFDHCRDAQMRERYRRKIRGKG